MDRGVNDDPDNYEHRQHNRCGYNGEQSGQCALDVDHGEFLAGGSGSRVLLGLDGAEPRHHTVKIKINGGGQECPPYTS
jgi:hypothetical protein